MTLKSLFGLDGRVALVTGGAQGIGRMIASALCAAGCRVYITSRSLEDGEATAKEISPEGLCVALAAKLNEVAEIRDLVTRIAEREPALHILVNNAGSTWGEPLDRFPEARWDGVLAVNLRAPFYLVQSALAMLAAQATADSPARIINIGSIAGLVPSGNASYSYDVSKAAIHHLTRVLAADLASRHITVNAIAPGYFPSRMTRFIGGDDARLNANLSRIPLRRWGREEDIAGLVLYLAARAGAYMTGAVIPLDGGLSIGGGASPS